MLASVPVLTVVVLFSFKSLLVCVKLLCFIISKNQQNVISFESCDTLFKLAYNHVHWVGRYSGLTFTTYGPRLLYKQSWQLILSNVHLFYCL